VRIVLLGPPGAGKGTQAGLLADRFDAAHIATGDLLRTAAASGTDLGLKAKEYMDAGELVPDELVLSLLRERLEQPDARAGFVLDGFPRTLMQARELAEMLDDMGRQVDAAVAIEVSDELIIKRLSARWTCPQCSRVYNMISSPPKVDSVCDVDATKLIQREDDRPEVIKNRLDVFREATMPVVRFYLIRGLLRKVEGDGTADQVLKRILARLQTPGGAA
jgi:adenylate kinase